MLEFIEVWQPGQEPYILCHRDGVVEEPTYPIVQLRNSGKLFPNTPYRVDDDLRLISVGKLGPDGLKLHAESLGLEVSADAVV